LEQGKSLRDRDSARSADDYRTTSWPYPDPPLVVKPAPLSDDDIEIALKEMIPAWTVESNDGDTPQVELFRQLTFRSFLDVLDFMSDIGRFCDQANHHPRWENIYRTLLIHLSTWDIGHRVSHLDLTLAAHMDKVFARYQATNGAN
jgi:pterin-4a-carbinolamine dehydratase